MNNRSPLAALAAACLSLTMLAGFATSPAMAGSYTVHTCRQSNGAAAAVTDWILSRTSLQASLTNSCPNGALTLQLAPNVRHPSNAAASITFTAPADTTISNYTLYRSVKLGSRYNYRLDEIGWGTAETCFTSDGRCSWLGNPATPLGSASFKGMTGHPGVRAIVLKLTCGEDDATSTACPIFNPSGIVQLYRGMITIADTVAPRFEPAPSGPLLAPGPVRGTPTVRINASDRGGGVQSAMLELDGRVIAAQTPDSNGGRCAPPYTAARPCPLNAATDMPLDTTRLADGAHTLRLHLVDAAGNLATWGPAQFVVDNTTRPAPPTPPASNTPTLSAQFVVREATPGHPALLRPTVLSRYNRVVRVVGQLLAPDGASAANTRVDLFTQEDRAGASTEHVGDTSTDAEGRFAFSIPRGSSRTVTVVHYTDKGIPIASAELSLRVRAGVSLGASRTHLRNGERVRLAGRLLQGPVPRRGVLVTLQTKRGSVWQALGTTRSKADGRYAYLRRFTGPRHVTVRALVAKQESYPYERGGTGGLGLVVGG